MSDDEKLFVTRYACVWLKKSSEEQTRHLIEAWQSAPRNLGVRRFRKKFLWKLKYDQPLGFVPGVRHTGGTKPPVQPLGQKDLSAMRGLEALGLCADGRLISWGRLFIKDEGSPPTPKPSQPCCISNDHFIASLPDHTDLLWEIEELIRPSSPGIYSLSKKKLNNIRGEPQLLVTLLERGLQHELPGEIKAQLLDQPSLRVIEGVVLEFSHPAELRALRRQPSLRRSIEQVLSPRHVIVSSRNVPALLKILKRRGVHLTLNEEKVETHRRRTHFLNVSPPFHEFESDKDTSSKLELLEKYRQL